MLLENGLLLDRQSLEKLKNATSPLFIEFNNIDNPLNAILLREQINQIEQVNTILPYKYHIKYNVDKTTIAAMQHPVEPRINQQLKDFYCNMAKVNIGGKKPKDATAELTIWDQIVHGKIQEFATKYSKDFLLNQYKDTTTGWFEVFKWRKKKNKVTENGIRISKNRLDQINKLQEIIGNADQSILSNGPTERISFMLEELKALRKEVQQEGNVFDSRLDKVLEEMIDKLSVIRTMNNACNGTPSSKLTQRAKQLQSQTSIDGLATTSPSQGPITHQSKSSRAEPQPLTEAQLEQLTLAEKEHRKEFLENIYQTKGNLPDNLLAELHTLLIHSITPLTDHELGHILTAEERGERLQWIKSFDETTQKALTKEIQLMEHSLKDSEFYAAPPPKKPPESRLSTT